ncbi:MAG: hypothetical protein HW397_187 [Dehalococcoidia bacterium]|nr:hypothetical protein [Dehalococcoidia bacterium]
MALSIAWPISGEKRTDWERMIQFYGFCEVLPDRSKPQQVEKAFKDWAMKRHLAYVEGQNMVAFDPKAFNPKDSLDRGKFAFIARYFRPRETMVFQRDLETAFNIRSMYVLDAIQSYWLTEGVVHDVGGRIQADRDLLRLMGFTYIELMQALDGVVKKQYLEAVPNGHRLADPVFGVEFGQYIVNFDILKERFFDGEFVLQAAGQPIPFVELSRQTGIENVEDLRNILREAKKRYDLNIEVSDDHVMFGPPSKSAVEALIARERTHKDRLSETEGQLKERSKTIRDLVDRYTVREAKIMNEIESLRDEGKMVYVKSKVVDAVQSKIGENGRK